MVVWYFYFELGLHWQVWLRLPLTSFGFATDPESKFSGSLCRWKEQSLR